jgi:hypothetical protein
MTRGLVNAGFYLGQQCCSVLLQAEVCLEAEVLQLLLEQVLLSEGGEGVGRAGQVVASALVQAASQLQLQRQSLCLQRCLVGVVRQPTPAGAVALHSRSCTLISALFRNRLTVLQRILW